MANNKIKVSELDFDQIKTNLRQFLEGQDTFTDYNFEGSALNVLLDILAYNTHYNAMYTNLAVNEMFLDSASKRDSIVSIANNFGYLPSSRRCAKATINMSVPVENNTAATLSLPKYSPFTSTDFTFYNTIEYVGVRSTDDTEYVFNNIEILQGTPVTESFPVTNNSKYILRNNNIDISTIKVSVQEVTESLNVTTYAYSETMIGLTQNDQVYFIKEIEGGKYEIYFGKNNLGKEPVIGSTVFVEYMVTDGETANGSAIFLYGGNFGSVPTITLVSAALGGREVESNDEVKYNVSHMFKTQNRAVTAQDYADIIKANYADVDAVSVWGGETQSPPIYGKIYIAIKPKSGLFLIPSEKSYILERILKPKIMMGVFPEIVDAEYVDVQLDVQVFYNANISRFSSNQIVELVRQTIENYNDVNLQKFDGVLRYSRLNNAIDKTDSSIVNSIMVMKLRKVVDVYYNQRVSYTVNFNNQIAISGLPEQYVVSNGFYIDAFDTIYYIDDDGAGKLRLFYYNPSDYTKIVVNNNIGTVDYELGRLVISDIMITGVVESNLQFIVNPKPQNVASKYNSIVNINPDYLTITAIQDNTSVA